MSGRERQRVGHFRYALRALVGGDVVKVQERPSPHDTMIPRQGPPCAPGDGYPPAEDVGAAGKPHSDISAASRNISMLRPEA